MNRHRLKRKAKFATVGAAGLAISFATLWLTVDILDWHPSAGYAAQTLAALHTNYTLNNAWTWRDRRTGTYWRRAGRFYLSRVGIMLPINQLLFWLINPHVGIYAANAICITAATIANWFINDRFVFKPSTTGETVK